MKKVYKNKGVHGDTSDVHAHVTICICHVSTIIVQTINRNFFNMHKKWRKIFFSLLQRQYTFH